MAIPQRVISMEEELFLANQMATELNNVTNHSEDVKRWQDCADIASDVNVVTPTIQDASPTDLFLVESTARALASSAGISSESLTVGLEDYRGKRLSLESISDFIVAMYRAIASTLAKIWNSVTTFFTAVFGTLPRMRYSLTRLKQKVDVVSDEYRWPKKLDLGMEIATLSVNDKLPKFVPDIQKNAMALYDSINFYLGEYALQAVQVFENVCYELEHYNEENPIESTNALCYEAKQLTERQYPPVFTPVSTNDSRLIASTPAEQFFAIVNLPTDKTLFIKQTKLSDPANPLAQAEAIQNCSILMMDTKANRKVEFDREGTIVTPTLEECKQILSWVSGFCDIMEAYNPQYQKLLKLKSRMLDATKDLVDRVRDIEGTSTHLAHYKAAIRFNSHLTLGVSQTCTQLTSMSLAVCRALMIIVEKTLISGND